MFKLSNGSPCLREDGGGLPATAASLLVEPREETEEAEQRLDDVAGVEQRLDDVAGVEQRLDDVSHRLRRSGPPPLRVPATERQAGPPERQQPPAATLLAVILVLVTLAVALAVGRAQGVLFAPPGGPPGDDVPTALPRSLPFGKGMWIWQVGQTEGGNVGAIVARARATGLTHLYVRTGSSWDGFYAGPFLDQLLPKAHAAGLRVYGWDFPNLASWSDDVNRAAAAVAYRTPKHHQLDGFAADIETEHEGTHINAEVATAYGNGLRQAVGDGYPLIAVVPRPSPHRTSFPYAQVVERFDAIAPMVYWLNREPASDMAGAARDLAPFGKPLFPVGQAYDGGPEGDHPGVPPRAELLRFMEVAHEYQAGGVSFWSWQAADQQAWDAIRDAPQFSQGQARS